FGRQAIPMVWDFTEIDPFATATGSWHASLSMIINALALSPTQGAGQVQQTPAQSLDLSGKLLSTDPPYYDNVGYSDLSDFFYVWHRRTIGISSRGLTSTLLVPKAEELVANPYRHDGKTRAKNFFEDGFRSIFARARETALNDFPITVYYAFKQSET